MQPKKIDRTFYTHHTLKYSFFFQKMEVLCDLCTKFRKIPLSSAEKVAKMLDVTVCKDFFLEKLQESFERIQIR